MSGDKLFTQKDLAERWQVSEKTIETYRKEGIIKPVSFIKHPRFEPSYIRNLELEGVKFDRFSPLERRKLEREIEDLKRENLLLKQVWLRMLAESANIAPLIK